MTGRPGEMTRLCGYLPLAIGMLARQLRHHPAWNAAGLAAELAAARDRLELMRAENLSVAAAFDLSYRDLTEASSGCSGGSACIPGPDIDAYAAAALDGTDLAAARRHLDGLYDHHLLTEPARAGTGFMTCSASTPARWPLAGDPGIARRGRRLLNYYAAHCRWPPAGTSPPGAPSRPAAARRPARLAPQLATPGQAAAWLDAERANLHAAASFAAASGRPVHAIAIPAAMGGFLRARGHWDQAAALYQTALAAARQAGTGPARPVSLTSWASCSC